MNDNSGPLPIDRWSEAYLQAHLRRAAASYDAEILIEVFTTHHATLKPKTLRTYSHVARSYTRWAEERGLTLSSPECGMTKPT